MLKQLTSMPGDLVELKSARLVTHLSKMINKTFLKQFRP